MSSRKPSRGRAGFAAAGILAAAALISVVQTSAQAARRRRGAGLACPVLARPDREGRYLAREDLLPPAAPVDGNDLLALVNRSPRWVLDPGFAPSDLVDVRTMRSTPAWQCVPPRHQCMRREAAEALRRMIAAMAWAGESAWYDSSFRGYRVQCGVFQMWARDGRGFCAATTASALPGHSQHQLGTAVDLFTRSWLEGGPRFRDGFGCSPGGRWLAEHSWEYGFVLPYPLHPDDRAPGSDCAARPGASGRVDPRTGYKYEPWHLRYIGVDNAARFHAAWLASGPGTADEITLEQWLRVRLGLPDAVEPPVCDGCACGACATFRGAPAGPCQGNALALGADGAPLPAAGPPRVLDVVAEREGSAVRVRATVEVPANTLTQPPVLTATSGVAYAPGASFERLVVVPGGVVHAYAPLPGAWRLAVGPACAGALPWRAALVDQARDPVVNGVNARIPATAGRVTVTVPIESVAPGTALRVALVREGDVLGARVVAAP